jgi:hypothetical protein
MRGRVEGVEAIELNRGVGMRIKGMMTELEWATAEVPRLHCTPRFSVLSFPGFQDLLGPLTVPVCRPHQAHH